MFLFQARDADIKPERNEHADRPADGPRPTHARKAEKGRKDKHEPDAENKVGKGADHKPDIAVTAADGAVRHDLDVYDEEKEGRDPYIFDARFYGEFAALPFRHEQPYERFGKYETGNDEKGRKHRGNDEGRAEPLFDAPEFMGSVILRDEIRQPVCTGTEARRAENEQFDARGKAGRDADTLQIGKLVDFDLYDQISDRNETVLQGHGDREQDEQFEERIRKGNGALFRLQAGHAPEQKNERKYARSALGYESRPGNARNASRLYHKIVEHDIGYG